MKKSMFTVFGLILILFCIQAQNGYKEYSWGLSIEQVKAKASDLTEESSFIGFQAPSRAMLFYYSAEITSSVPNPMKFEKGTVQEFFSEKQDLRYFFLDKRLFAVEVSFYGENIYDELTTKYGAITPASGAFLSYRFQTACWIDKGRLIVWEGAAEDRNLEKVTYVDSMWFSRIRKITMDKFRKTKADTKTKID